MRDAFLVLEDGTILKGKGFGASKHEVFELVFNTSITGYQEILTDASYKGQGVVFTAPHIGNVGINYEDYESEKPQVSALVVRSISPVVSNWRAAQPLSSWLEENDVPGISEVDTRYLTRKIREQGTMKAGITTDGLDPEVLLSEVKKWHGLDGIDMVKVVTIPEPYPWKTDEAQKWIVERLPIGDVDEGSTDRYRIILVDYGAKKNILRQLSKYDCDVLVVPATIDGSEVLSLDPDGIVLSNGPGDPAGLPYAVSNVKTMIESNVPVFGICLGHQLIGLALGGKTAKLKFGHHGGNHPVQNILTRKTMVTSQNHNYMVDKDTLDSDRVSITHVSLNDYSVEGLRLIDQPVFSVQFHPEASPGPHDGFGLFAEFIQLVHRGKHDA